MYKLGKKGGEKYLSIWWFFILVMITLGIVAGVYINTLDDVETKSLESEILATKLVDCLVVNGEIKQELINKTLDILAECHLDKKIIGESGKYYIGINISGDIQQLGVGDFETQCALNGEHYPKCVVKTVYALNSTGSKFLLLIKAGSNKEGGQVDK